jgi:hypothetical protein
MMTTALSTSVVFEERSFLDGDGHEKWRTESEGGRVVVLVVSQFCNACSELQAQLRSAIELLPLGIGFTLIVRTIVLPPSFAVGGLGLNISNVPTLLLYHEGSLKGGWEGLDKSETNQQVQFRLLQILIGDLR